MSISNLATYFIVQVQSDQETKKKREEEIKIYMAYLKRYEKANETHLNNLAKQLNKEPDWVKDLVKKGALTELQSAGITGIIKAAEIVLAKQLGKGAFAASATSKLLPVIGVGSAILDASLFIHEVKDVIDKMKMVQDAARDKFTLEAIEAAIDRGDPNAKLIFEEIKNLATKEYWVSGGGGRLGEETRHLHEPPGVEGALEILRNIPGKAAELNYFENLYAGLLSSGYSKTKVIPYQGYFEDLAKETKYWNEERNKFYITMDNSQELYNRIKLGKPRVGEVSEADIWGNTSDPFTDNRPYFTSDFLENLPRQIDYSKMLMLPPAKQYEEEPWPPEYGADYEFGMPEKVPEPVKKGYSGGFAGGNGNGDGYYSYSKQAPQPEVDWTQEFLDNIPYEPDLFNQVMLPPSSSGKAGVDKSQTKTGAEAGAGGTVKSSGFFGGMKDSFWSGVDQLKQQFGLGGDKGMLGNLFGGKDTGGGLFGMLGSFAGPQSGLVGTIQKFASMLPGIGTMISGIIGGIGDFIKDINTELFLFIKYNYSLQHRYAKESNVGIGFIPVRAAQWDAYKY